MAENKIRKFDWLRAISTALLVCAIVFGLFYIHSGKVADVIAFLEAELNTDKATKYPNTIWLIEFVSAAVPIFAAVIVMNIMYCDKKSYVPVYTQREKLVVSVTLAVFIFGALLAYVFYQSRSGEITDPETGEVIKTLWDRTYMWFFAQILPMIMLISYHSVRIGTEKRELLETESAVVTDEQGDALNETDEKIADVDAEDAE